VRASDRGRRADEYAVDGNPVIREEKYMTASDDQLEPYSSLDALRRVNDDLLAALPDGGTSVSAKAPLPNEAGVREFIRRTVATGVLLDTAADRRAAQGLIDYWASNYLLTFDDLGNRQTMSGRRNMALKPFDAELVDSVAKRGEEAIAALNPKDRELARWILLRLFRLPDGARVCVSSPVSRESLLSLGDHQHVNDLLAHLVEAGVIKITPGSDGDLVEIRYEALERRWETLRNWIEARVKFRDAALYWLRSGKDPGALLGASLWEEAKAYGNLSEIEQDFVSQSRKRGRRLLGVGIGAAVVLLLVPVFGNGLYDIIRQRLYVPYETQNWKEILKTTQDKQKKAEGYRWLAANDPPLYLSTQRLFDIDLAGIDATLAQFVKAHLTKMIFAKARLIAANFSQSEIVNSNFTGATLDGARFGDATIAATSFSNASLHQSIFDRALFCQNVNFSAADVRAASFRYVTFDGDHVPQFGKTAWWLAVGWSMTQVEKLMTQTDSNRKIYKDTKAFKDESDDDEAGLKATTAPTPFRAELLNGKAWNLATYGVDLDDAENASTEAVGIISSLVKKSGSDTSAAMPAVQANYIDTLAYILFQAGKKSDALEKWQAVVTKTQDPPGEWIFRYAVALFDQGQNDEAIKNLKLAMDEKKYYPSHELLLLWPQINKEPFRSTIEQLIKKGQPPANPTRVGCPSVSPSGAG
jgi:hypothetical protein